MFVAQYKPGVCITICLFNLLVVKTTGELYFFIFGSYTENTEKMENLHNLNAYNVFTTNTFKNFVHTCINVIFQI